MENTAPMNTSMHKVQIKIKCGESSGSHVADTKGGHGKENYKNSFKGLAT